MSKKFKFLTFFCLGVIFVFKGYIIVIGQTKPVLVALNKNDATLAIIDPVTMKVTAKVPTGDGPHEVVLSPDGKIAYVANYGAQVAGRRPIPQACAAVVWTARARWLWRSG